MAVSKDKAKILVASSHETSLHVIAIMLHKLGYANVFESADGPGAEKVVNDYTRDNSGMTGLLGASAPKEICDLDLVIVDGDLAPTTGLGFLTRLRARFGPDQVPVIFTTSNGKDGGADAANKAGANDVLNKPFTLEALKAKLELILGSDRPPVVRSFNVAEAWGAKPKPLAPSSTAKKKEPSAIPAAPSAPAAPLPPGKVSKSGGGVSFIGREGSRGYSTDGPPTAKLVDGKINGHYHEKVDVIGGGVNCYWAREAEGEDAVVLEYLSTRGKPTGMEAKRIPRERFMYTFYLCEEHGCPILDRLKEEENKKKAGG